MSLNSSMYFPVASSFVNSPRLISTLSSDVFTTLFSMYKYFPSSFFTVNLRFSRSSSVMFSLSSVFSIFKSPFSSISSYLSSICTVVSSPFSTVAVLAVYAPLLSACNPVFPSFTYTNS